MDTGISIFDQNYFSFNDHNPLFAQTFDWQLGRVDKLPSSLLGVEKLDILVSTTSEIPSSTVVNSSYPSKLDPFFGTSLVVNAEAVNISLLQVKDSLHNFLQQPNYRDSLQLAFGSGWQEETASALINDLAQGKNSPEIKIVKVEALQARGAYSQQTNTIYLAQEFVEQNSTDAIAKVLTEELGHYIDSKLNTVDSPGDEGEIFAALVDGTKLKSAQIQALKAEDDHAIRLLDGQLISIEQASLDKNSAITRLGNLGEVLRVPGNNNEGTTLLFQWTAREASYNNEIGVFVVDEQGQVNGIKPTEAGYAQAALTSTSRQVLFSSGQKAGDWRQLTFQEGQYLAFYLIQNNTAENWLATNPQNQLDKKTLAFFSINSANPDNFNHVKSQSMGDSIWQLRWEDLVNGGDQDFNDVVFNVSLLGLKTPGNLGQTVPTQISLISKEAKFKHEMGLFLVDDAYGRIGNLTPDNPNYINVALSADRRQVIFDFDQPKLTTVNLNLPAGQYIGWYLISNGTTEQFLSDNPTNLPGKSINAFFSYSAANPDGLNHVHHQAQNVLAWEDLFGAGDRDYNDLIFRFNFATPNVVNNSPTEINLSLTNNNENITPDSIIGDFTAIDPNPQNTHVYSLVNGEGDEDNDVFKIVGNKLIITQYPDFETKPTYKIRVRTTDQDGLNFEQSFTVNIADINEAPSNILLDANNVEENVDGAVIGTISVIDTDTSPAFINNTVTVNDDRFEVISNNETLQLKLKNGRSLDYEVATTVPIILTATDVNDSSLTYSKNFTISVTDINENAQLPALSASLANDTGLSNSDRLTQDPTVSGQIEGATSLEANLNGNGFVDISNALNEDGSFTISLEQYDVLSNGALPDGEYTLELKASSSSGQESEIVTVSFNLDLTPPPLTFGLAPESDTGILGDGITSDRFVTLVGQTDPGLTVALLETQQMLTADSQGNFNFTDVAMPVAGKAPFTIVAVDAAGNQGRSQQFLTREGINDAPEITSTPESIFDTETQSTYTYKIAAIDPDGDELTYTLLNTPQGAEIDENGLLSFTPSGTLRSSYNFSVEVSDGRGGTDSQTFTVEVPTSANLGTIRGIKWNDLNGNGKRELVNFDDFSVSTSSLKLGGNAAIVSSELTGGTNVLRLTPAVSWQAGNALLQNPFDIVDENGEILSFSTKFKFSISNSGGISDSDGTGADGIAFIISPTENVGIAGGGIGYAGLINSVAVELDTFNNNALGVDSNNGNHIGININGNLASIAQTNIPDLFNNGNVWNVWIDYDGKSQLLEARVSQDSDRPIAPTVSSTVNIPQILGQENIFVGFTSATGSAWGNHDILSWTFETNEPGIAGVSVYLDINNNQQLDPGEPSQVTAEDDPSTPDIDETGQYEFTNLAPGTYIVREIIPDGFEQTFPSSSTTTTTINFDNLTRGKTSGNIFADSGVLFSSAKSTGTVALNNILTLDKATNDFVVQPARWSSPPYGVIATNNDDILLEFTQPVTSVKLITDIVFENLSADIVRLVALEKLESNKFKVLGFDEVLDNKTTPEDATLSLNLLDTPFSYALFEVTTELEGFDDLTFTTSSNNFYKIVLKAGEIVENIDFGNVISTANNRPPVFTSEPIIVGNIGTEYTYQPTATDPDGDSLTFSLIEAPDGLTIETETGLLVWTAIANQLGENLVTIQVSDEAGLTNTQSFTITIQERATNNAPIFISNPVTNFAVAVPNTATGQVNPELVSLNLAEGETAISPVSIKLPSGGTSTGGQADIVFVVDESGSMAGEHEWLTDMVLELDTALRERGITDSRYSLIGYTSQTRIFNLAATTQVAVYGPGNQLVATGSFEAFINNPQLEFNLLADGNYTVVISPIGASALPIEYNLNADITNLPDIALTNFNTPFTANVAPQGQETFTFNAPAGTQIFFDGLNSSAVNDIRARLVDPNGNNIFSNVRLNQNTNPYLLSQSGTYSLLVSGGTTGGNFSFQLLEFNSKATEIALDTQISGTISPGFATEVFQFSATQGQTIYFDSAANQSITAAVYSPDNGLLGSRTSLRDFTLTIPSNGTYSLVLQSDSTNPVNYNFRLVTPETQQVNLAIGDIATGNLGEAGEEDIYLLEGKAGQRIWFDGLSADSSSIVARLVSPTGVQVFGSTRSDRNSVPLILPESGIYSLVVNGADQIGNYSFQVLDFITNATDITSEVASSTEINITFDTGLQTKLYTFAGTKGQKLAFDAVSTSGSVSGNWQLYAPDNARLAQTNISSDFTVVLPADGTYTLLLDGSNGSPFNLTFQISEQVIEESTIALGDTVSGTLANSSEQDVYRFSGNAGQRIWFDGLASSSTNIRVRLASSTGQTLFNGLSANNDSEILTLPETGTYHITVNGNNVTGNYNFRVLNITDATSLTLGTDLSNTITPGLGTQLYTFEGNAGQKLLFDMVAVNNSFSGSWVLYGPGSNNFLARNTRLDDFTAVLPTNGTHTLLVDGNSNNPISYTFNVQDISTPNNVAPSGFGITRTGNITTPSQEDIFTFEASAGTRIVFDGLTSSSSNIRARLTAPDGTQLFSNLQLTNNFDQLILPESGSYSIAVTTTGALGNYSFRVLNLDDATTLPLDTVFNGSLSIGQGRDIYKFTGTAGQQLFFDGISATGSGNWRLYSPENIQLAQSGITNNFTATLPTDGTYFVIFDGTSVTPVNFSVQVVNLEIQESTLTIGETISGELTKVGQQDIYRFNASAGQRILFDGLGSTNLATNARLVSPTGVQVLGNTRSDRNSAPLILTESGEYFLIITAGDRTDNYSFRLLDLDAPTTSINLNTVVSGTVTSALATEVYQFTGNAGQEIFFNALTNTGSLTWTILGSSNADLGSRSFPQDFFTVLPSDGIYTLLLNSSSANPVNFSWEIVTPQRETATINYGEVITGDLSQAGETDIYQFSGVAGQQIWFDGLESASTEIEVAMVSPGGDRIFERLRLDRDNSTPLTLFESGTYSLIINSGRGNPGAVTGDYRFQVLEITPNLTVPNDLIGTISYPNEAQIYQFAGVKGQKLTFTPNDAIFGTAAQISNATQFLSTSQGGTEDGYLGIDKALQLPFRDGAAVNIILVTDEDRDIFNQNLTFESIFNGLESRNALLNATINALFFDGSGNAALGVDSDGTAYIADGTGGFITSSGGVFSKLGTNPDPFNPIRSVKEDYIDLAWDIGGAAWDLNQLRLGGNTAVSFTKAFVNVKATEINEQLAINLLVTDPNVTIENLTGPIFGLNPGETASFDAKITGDGLARSFEILFVRPETGFVVGSIPVSINQNYLYLAQAVDPDGDSLTYNLLNAPTGATINATTGRIDWTPPTTGLYQFEVGVADNRGAQTVQSYQVQVVAAGGDNTAPNITSTVPNTIRVGGNLAYQVTATDVENDPLTFFLADAPQGVSIDLDTGLLSWTPSNDQTGEQAITVKVVDGRGGSDTQSFVITVNDNQKPVFTSNPIRLGQPNQLYEYDVNATDPEGTAITYSLRTGSPDGITINPETGLIQWQPTTQQTGQFPITVIATDAEGERSLQSYILNIGTSGSTGGGDTGGGGTGGGTDNEIPTIFLGFSSTVVEIGENLTLQVQAVDNESIVSLTLQANGTPLNLTPGNIANGAINETTVQFAQAGLIDIIATAEDNDGNIGTRTLTVRVIDPNDQQAPTVALDLSGFDPLNPVITNLTNIVGTIDDPGIEFYRVELAPVSLINLNNPAANDPDFITIAEGRGSINNGVLAQIDPRLYRNDSYYIRVYAQDYSGNANVQGVVLDINSQNKPGRFALEFTDLSIPLTGIPIEIQRRYDSLDTKFSGDFGYGWSLGFQDAQIQEAAPTGVDLSRDNFFGGNSFTVGTRVTLTTPDGRRVGFTFNPVPDFAGFLGVRYKPTFTPDAGVYDRLEVDYTPLSVRSDGSVGLYVFSGFTYNPSQYRLITKDGTTYRYDQYQGLLDITDRNGNKLTYTDAGIFSSTGQSITFNRDAQGRITEIIDPVGKVIAYSYDAQGNLVSVSDRNSNTTQFVYDTQLPSYLTEIIDPLGRKGTRTEYDEQGRIIRLIDAEGNALDLSYSGGASSQTIKDPFGNSLTRVFDARGNVVQEVDALGGITQRTFDNNDNLLSETDPEGNTKSYTYDSRGNILAETDGEGNTKRYTYNARNDILTETDALGNVTTYTYDANGNLSSRKDALGNVTTYKYAQNGLLTEVIDANGQTSTFSYDVYGNLTELVDPTGAKTAFTYDRNGQVTSVIDALGAITNYVYDAQGRLVEQTDPEGNACGCGTRGITRTEYNAAGEKIAEIDALGRRTEYRYNERGLLIETIFPDETPNDLSDNPRIKDEYDALDRLIINIDELGRKTHYIYDALGRQIEIIYPDSTPDDLSDNPRMRTEYDKSGRIIAEIDELGNRTEFAYDKAGRLITSNNALNEITLYSYDADGRQISITDALGRTTNYSYDALDRITSTTYANNTVMTTTYDALGRIIAQTDLAGNTTNYEYDPLGQLTAVIDALNQRTEYKYDAVGNLIEQKDANSHITKFEYDSLRRRTAMILPLGQRSEMNYDKVGNLVTITDFNGDVTTYNYDVRDRLITKSFSDDTPTETFTYTLTGELATVTDNRGVTNYGYDERDRLLFRTEPDGRTISYTYDLAGNILTLAVPSGTTTYTYDPLNRIDTVIDPDSGITRYTYDAVGNLIKTEFPNGVTENQQYDLLNRLTYLENRNSTDILSSYTYTLDAMGNRIKVEEHNGRIVEYIYDDLYRLTQERITDTFAGNKTVEYLFDPVGNRLQRIDSVEGTTTYTYDANDRLLEEILGGKVTQYQYDAKGNLTAKVENGETLAEYEWNAKGELVAVEVTENGETGRIEFEYDHNGIRVAINIDGEETRFLIDTNQQQYAQVIEEYQANGTVNTSYVHGWDLISQADADGKIYYQVDGLGSTRLLTDNDGAILVEYDYDAYGNLTRKVGDANNNYLFAGEQFDEAVDGYYLRARYYDHSTGRFVSTDPFEGYNDQPITLHDYLYAGVNPVNAIDPSGEASLFSYLRIAAITTGAFLARNSSSIFKIIEFILDAFYLIAQLIDPAIQTPPTSPPQQEQSQPSNPSGNNQGSNSGGNGGNGNSGGSRGSSGNQGGNPGGNQPPNSNRNSTSTNPSPVRQRRPEAFSRIIRGLPRRR